MSQWTNKLKNHPVWNHLQSLGPAIDDALNREGLDPQALEGLSRLKSVLTFTGRRLAGADPFLVHFGNLDSLSSQLQTITQEVQNFTANGNIGHITNANTNADSALNTLAQINLLLTTEDFLAAKEGAESYRKGLNTIVTELRISSDKLSKEIETLRADTEALKSEVSSEKLRLATVSSDAQSKFVSDQEVRSAEFLRAQKELKDQCAALLADFTQKLDSQNSDFTKQGEKIVKKHEQELEALNDEFVDATTKIRDEIVARKEEVEKLVGVIGNLGVTSGYLKAAKEAKITCIVWQVVTVLAMVGLIGVAIYAFLPAIGGSFSWGSFAGRVFISLTFGVLAAYAASQADKYQKVERQSRRLALELEAIGPFIAPLPEEKQQEFRMNVGERTFGHGDGVHGVIDSKSPATLIDLLLQSKDSKEFRTLLTDIIKAVK